MARKKNGASKNHTGTLHRDIATQMRWEKRMAATFFMLGLGIPVLIMLDFPFWAIMRWHVQQRQWVCQCIYDGIYWLFSALWMYPILVCTSCYELFVAIFSPLLDVFIDLYCTTVTGASVTACHRCNLNNT